MDTDDTPASGIAQIVRGMQPDDERLAFTEQQVLLADALYGATLMYTPAATHRMFWMLDVEVGDTVVEQSTWYQPSRRWQDRIGILVRVHDEPRLDEEGATYAHERYWTIRTCEREFRWHNARFVRIPTTRHQSMLFEGHGHRCLAADCRECAREQWVRDGQVLRRARRNAI